MTIDQTMTPPPTTVPNKDTMTQAEFDSAADARMAWEPTHIAEETTLSSQMNITASEINDNKLAAQTAQASAEEAQSSAETAESNAESWSDHAEQWANANEDVEIETGKYSGKHWASKAAKGDLYKSTSLSSIEIGTGIKTFTLVEENRAYMAGSRVAIVDSTDTDQMMTGVVTSYTENLLSVEVTDKSGSGTVSTWNIMLSVAGDAATLNGKTALDLIPAQTGHAGKFLSSDGVTTSWKSMDLSAIKTNIALNSFKIMANDNLSTQEFANGIIDDFEDTEGVRDGTTYNKYLLEQKYSNYLKDLSTAGYPSYFYTERDRAICFSGDGYTMFAAEGSLISQYDLHDPFVTTGGVDNDKSFAPGEETNIYSIFVSTDGSKLYVLGTGHNTVYQYTLVVPNDITTAIYDSKSKSLTGEDSTPYSIYFNPTGTRMFVLGKNTRNIYQYDLGTGWDVSTASYNGVYFDTSTFMTNSPYELSFDSTGKYGYVNYATYFYRFEMETPWDLSTAEYVTNKYDLSAYVPNPYGMAFKPDGTKAYFIDSSDYIEQYSLETPWDISTLTYDSKNKSVGSQDTQPKEVRFKPDGTEMYVMGYTNDTVYQYHLTTAWDVSTASFTTGDLFSVASQESNPDGLDFSSDGRKMYVLGPSGRVVFEYDLGTAWEVNTASYNSVSHSVSSEDSSPYVLKFSSDGTKFYISGPSNDTIYQYSLSDAWDLSSAVEYTGKHIDISSQEGNIQSIYFNSDGTRMYVVGTTNESVFQYDLDTAWDVSTATYIGNDIVLSEASQSYGSRISPDGTKFYAAHTGGSKYYSYDLTVPYNIGSAVYTEQRASITAPREMVFSPDGTKLFVYNQAAGYIYQHPLSTAWDITTLGASEESLSIGTATDGLRFEPDGSALYYIDNTNHYIYRRELTTAWDISSVSALHYLTGVTTSVYSFDFKEDMTKLFVINSSKSVYSYDIPEGWSSGDALLNQTVLKSFSSDIGTCCSMKFGDGGHSLYFANSNTEELMKYSMNTAYDVENAEKTNTALYVGHEQINVTGFHIADDNVYICGISSAYCHQYPMLESRKNTSLLSEEFDAVSSPAKADVIIWSEAIDALTLNTDFCAYIGRESAKDCTTDYETDDRIHVASHGYQNGDQILFFLPGGTYPYGIEKRTPYFVVNSDTDDFEISETVGGDSIDIRSDKTATLADSEYTGVSLKAEAPLPVGFYFKPDGLKFYVIDNNYDYVRQYSMTTAWDLSTASYDDISSVSVASEETNAYGFTFSTDGMHFFIVGVTTQEVYQYDMTTAWDIETATYSNNSFSVSGYDTSPMGVEFNSDGTKMYITGNSGDDITMFSLSSPWDLSVTPTFTTGDVFSISGQEGASQSMRFNIDGTEMYMIGRSNDTLFKYSLSTAWDIKTATYSGDSFSVADQHGNPQDLFFNPDQTKLFIVGFNPDEIHEYRIFINDSLTVQRVSKAELSKIADATVGQMLYGTADISNQASDTKMQYFLKSNNRKAIDIYGVSLQWGS